MENLNYKIELTADEALVPTSIELHSAHYQPVFEDSAFELVTGERLRSMCYSP